MSIDSLANLVFVSIAQVRNAGSHQLSFLIVLDVGAVPNQTLAFSLIATHATTTLETTDAAEEAEDVVVTAVEAPRLVPAPVEVQPRAEVNLAEAHLAGVPLAELGVSPGAALLGVAEDKATLLQAVLPPVAKDEAAPREPGARLAEDLPQATKDEAAHLSLDPRCAEAPPRVDEDRPDAARPYWRAGPAVPRSLPLAAVARLPSPPLMS
ncbi:hypothetical protein PsYK624_044150 [Phanerochaete sordida]|uniref:Uncharacterized protein n=1 Tax=Phanerochaete sordida TaxID=48140 RepID=A0A9P3LBY9_9APHY|nr:hypothetical protein PsYK624_044150 [Phanerochaete sordida]